MYIRRIINDEMSLKKKKTHKLRIFVRMNDGGGKRRVQNFRASYTKTNNPNVLTADTAIYESTINPKFLKIRLSGRLKSRGERTLKCIVRQLFPF